MARHYVKKGGVGGKRKGAGRKPGKVVFQTTPEGQRFAERALRHADETPEGELEAWKPLLKAKSLKIRLEARKFLTTMRDGTPRPTEPAKSAGHVTVNFTVEALAPGAAQTPAWVKKGALAEAMESRDPSAARPESGA